MLVSLALEGKLANHGLTAMEDDDDVLTALTRELVTEQGIGECAAAVWKTLKQSRTSTPVADLVPQARAAGMVSPRLIPDTLDRSRLLSRGKLEQLSFAF